MPDGANTFLDDPNPALNQRYMLFGRGNVESQWEVRVKRGKFVISVCSKDGETQILVGFEDSPQCLGDGAPFSVREPLDCREGDVF